LGGCHCDAAKAVAHEPAGPLPRARCAARGAGDGSVSPRMIVVGAGMQAELVQFYFGQLGWREIDAFVLDPEYLRDETFLGRPVMDFAEARRRYPPATHGLFVAIGMLATAARKRWYLAAREAGYELPSFVHRSAVVSENVAVGAGTLIKEQVCVAPFARLGDNLVLGSQCCISHHTSVGDHSFVAPAATVAGGVEIGECCFIGAGAVVRDRVRIGAGCAIGASSVIMADCAPGGLYRPARTERTRDLKG
jgi:sugar O-acyltransferase (sialic acid O-acetyltransferase NeuD family)